MRPGGVHRTLVLAFCMLSIGVPAYAGAAEAPVTTAMSEKDALATQLMESMSPIAVFRQSTLDSFDRALVPLLTSPQFKELETRKPGVINAVASSVRLVLVKVIESNIPDYRRRLRAIIEPALTIDDMRAAVAFYRSPTGQKMLKAAVTGASSNTKNAVNTSANGTITVDRTWMDGAVNNGMVGAIQALSADDMPVVMEFAKSAAGPKIAALNERIKTEAADWANGLITKARPEIEATAKAAIIARLKAK